MREGFSGARRGFGSAFWQLLSLRGTDLMISQACGQPRGAGTGCRMPASRKGRLERCSPPSRLRCYPSLSGAPGTTAGSPVAPAVPGCPCCPWLPVIRVPWGRVRGQAGTARRHFRQRRREQVGGACCGVAPASGRAGGISSVISVLYPFLLFSQSLQPEKSPDGCHSSPHASWLAAPRVFHSSTSQRLSDARRAVLREAAEALH